MQDYRSWRLFIALSLAVLLSGCGGSGGGDGDSDIELVGLDARPANATCLAGPAPTSDAAIAVEEAFATFPNQSFAYPVGLLQGPDGNWYVLEQGKLYESGVRNKGPKIDFSS